ncbi:MAG: DUF3472 domain-containing protein [Acidimicrobiales bacterium]
MRLRPRPRPTARGPYTEWFWPPPPSVDARTGYRSFTHTVLPEVDPGPRATYFWAHQFGLEGGEGGYLGLQTRGDRADGSVGKMAIFSLWDATGADGPGVVRFGGEGEGWSARIPYLWSAGTAYRLVVAAAEVTSQGAWWSASVTDLATGEGREIGRLRSQPGWGGLGAWSIMWTEYYGPPLSSCADLAPVSTVFGEPRAEGGVVPLRSHSHVGDGTCDTTRITPVPGGVRQEMGGVP